MNDRVALLVALLALAAVLAYAAVSWREGYAIGMPRMPLYTIDASHMTRASKATGVPMGRTEVLAVMQGLDMPVEQAVSVLETPLSFRGSTIPLPPVALLRDLAVCVLTRSDCSRATARVREFYNEDYELLMTHLLWLRQNATSRVEAESNRLLLGR